ncbi:MAG: lipopolysaccharide assembly protein LapB [Gammaproteobacteria bacterium]|nr:lipopolysaccharide assembly protein LapB [Gammaproteobacteria bacterium]
MPTDATFLLAGLFIIAAASGWAFERFSRERDNQPPARISADYIRGLNLVLNRKTDEALELFVQIAKVDDDTLETHFALGHLFRRRGEVDRAIRVHQNLLARPSLSEAQRHQALFALAEDYLGAGLFDRAESLFAELTTSSTQSRAALERLVDIYEREREWEKAIDAHRQLELRSGERSPRIAHYYCELAEQARVAGDTERALECLSNAEQTDSGALRAALIRAAIAKGRGELGRAIRLYEQVVAADRRFIAEVLPSVMDCYKEDGGLERFDAYVARLVEQDPSLEKELAYAAIIGDLVESPELADCVQSFVLSNEVLINLVNADELSPQDPQRRSAAIQRIVRGLRQLAMSSARYRCTNCGYSAQRLIWHCPSCKLWETVRPVQTFQFGALVS